MADLLPVIRQRFFDANGNPLAGGKLFSYIAGTSTPKVTYLDFAGTPNTNPVILDANGEANVRITTGYYKFVLKDANDVVLDTVDQVSLSIIAGNGMPVGGTTGQAAIKASNSDNDVTWQTLTKTMVGLSSVPNVDATVAANITQDTTHRFATDTEKATWNAKQNALVAGTDYLAPSGNGSSLTGLTKTQVSLSNVDNTSDATKNAATATFTNKTIQFLKLATANDSTTAGTNTTLAAFTTGIVRVTNGSLVSLSGIPAGSSGQQIVIENQTGNSFSINNDEATATAANRIYTGTGGVVSMLNNATFTFTYDSTSTHWMLTGGSGSGSGTGGQYPNWIAGGDAETGTAGWVTYQETDAVTFTDAGDLVNLTAHGLNNGAIVSFTSITSTTGISTNTAYYVVGVTANTFQVSATSGGSAIALTTNGSGTMVRYIPKTGASAGSPTVTWTSTTTQPIAGNSSFLLTKGASNTMAQGASYAFTTDSASAAKVMQIQFDYRVSSGTFVAGGLGVPGTDSDVTVYIYDTVNNVLIQPSTFRLYSNAGTPSSTFIANFQTASNSAGYRLIFHCASTSASAYTLELDNISVTRSSYVYGTPITDWKSYTMTVGATTTAPTKGTITIDKAWYRRVGDSVQIMYEYGHTTGGAAGSGTYLFPIPPGLNVDTTKVDNTRPFETTGGSLGSFVGSDSSTTYAGGVGVSQNLTNSVYLVGTTNLLVGSGGLNFGATNIRIAFNITVPILGWSSSVQMSDSSDTRVVEASYRLSTNFAASTTIPINFDTKITDTHGAVATSSTAWKFTAPTPGYYSVSVVGQASGVTNATNLYKNGSNERTMFSFHTAGTNVVASGTVIVLLNAGDFIEIRPTGNTTYEFSSAPQSSSIHIVKVQGPVGIAATETIAAHYQTGAGQSIANATYTTVVYGTKKDDSHGAYNTTTGEYTIPAAGRYSMSANAHFASASFPAGTTLELDFYIDGSIYGGSAKKIDATVTTDQNTGMASIMSVPLKAGQLVTVRAYQNTGGARSLLTTSAYNNFSIIRVGL